LEETKKKWRFGVNRWIVLLLILAGGYVAYGLGYMPVRPHIQMPAENVTDSLFNLFGQPFHITNTIVALLIADVILLLIGWNIRRASRRGDLAPKGISGAVVALMEVLYNMTEATAGKWAKTIFPYFATITLMVLVWNWTELIPGVDSIGWIEEAHEGQHGFDLEDTFLGIPTIVEPVVEGDHIEPAPDAGHGEPAPDAGHGEPAADDGHGEPVAEAGYGEEAAHKTYLLVPFVRVASTDLNFTLALAVISVVMTQVIGIKALGRSYFGKFLNTKTLFKVPMFGVIDFGVGLLELISEFSKVLSFAFRLFGNIFAGSVLLFVIGTLVPVFAQSAFLMLEFFVGLIQAIVFGMLTMTFMAQATISHDHGDEHAEAH